MSGPIRPALQNEEWQQRRSGPVSVDTLGDETHLSCDPDGDVVSVSGVDDIFAVVALTNDTLPNEDRRHRVLQALALAHVRACSRRPRDPPANRRGERPELRKRAFEEEVPLGVSVSGVSDPLCSGGGDAAWTA